MTDRTRGILFALAGTLMLATTGIFTSYLLTRFDLRPLTLAFWRALFAGLALAALLAWRKPAVLRIRRGDLPFFVIYGMFGQAAFNGLWAFSVQHNGAAVATVLAYTAPAFTVLLARPLLREPWTLRKAAAVALSLAGCALVARAYRADAWGLNLPGILTGVGTGLFYAIFSLLGRWGTQRFPNPLTVTTYGFLFAAFALSLTQVGGTAFSLGGNWNGWGVLLALALGPTILGFGLYTASLRYLPAGVAGLIASLEPAVTALLAILILSEWLDGFQWLGVALILAAVILVQAEAKPGPAPLHDEALRPMEAEQSAARQVQP